MGEMIPRNSTIGYLVYDDVMLPITAVVLEDGLIYFISNTWHAETFQMDENAACTIVGVDGSQISHVPRRDPPSIQAASGGTMHVRQGQRILEAHRPEDSDATVD